MLVLERFTQYCTLAPCSFVFQLTRPGQLLSTASIASSSPALTLRPSFCHDSHISGNVGSLKAQLLQEIETHPVVIFGESRCHAFTSAQKKLKKVGVHAVAFKTDMGEPHLSAEVKSILEEITGTASSPHVFVTGKFMPGMEAVASKLKHVKALVEKKGLETSIMREVRTNSVVIFSKLYCQSCTKSKQVFEDIGVETVVFEIDSDRLRGNRHVVDDVHAILVEMTNRQSFPYVFVDGSFVGGYEDIAALASREDLASLVDATVRETACASVEDSVRTEIESNHVVVFHGSSGRLTDEANEVLHNLSLEPVLFDLDAGGADIKEEVARILFDLTGGREAPYVFIHGRFIGNHAAIVALASNGKLEGPL